MKWTLYAFLQALDDAKFRFRLERGRDEAAIVYVIVPGAVGGGVPCRWRGEDRSVPG